MDLIKVFKYRYIHSSDIHSSVENKDDLAYYEGLMGKINAMAITIHPHTMKSWGWVADHFGDLASFENMDRFKPFGGSVEDMQQIKSEYPMTRWTFDINHVYTNDSSLSRMSDFYELLGDPGHYHVSGFRDEALPHTTLCTTGQDKIIDAVATEHPIIIESLGSSDIHLFRQEYDYIVARLKG
ncbi:MAG: hypothetical protein HZB75_01680 [Candidatus Saccharibacteria bacterium]|nr:MAG: hypothetical protein HZB75_01680 [Candidatus Saccharibacteria bacterium]